jgi:hypothetical protein
MSSEFLSQFESEDRVPASAALVSLHDVISRQVAVHWDEAVAVVEELCEVAIAGGGDTAPVPEFDDVLLASDGHVTLRRTRGEKSPTAAGRMLHALLTNGEVPMPLRLFVTQSTSHDTHGSLREFARGLAYFGKPDRHRLIQDLYTRSSQAGQGSPAATPVPPPIPASEPANEATRRKQPKREPIKKWLFAAALLGVVAGSGAWLWNRGGSTGDMQDGAVRMLSGAADALADLGQQVSQALGSEVPAPVAASADSTDDRSRPKPKRRPTADAVGAEPAPIVSRRVSLPKAAGASSLAAAMPPRVDFEATAVYAQPVGEPAHALEVTYSSADRDVEPPALVFPQLTPPLVRAGTFVPAMNRMVVVVSPEGTVERVQLVEGPARMVDMMLLSGAKTWKFTPAFKDGEPVRYRAVISWAVPQ